MQEKLTFEKENVIFKSIFSNLNLFNLIMVNFFVKFVHMNVQNFRYIKFTIEIGRSKMPEIKISIIVL